MAPNHDNPGSMSSLLSSPVRRAVGFACTVAALVAALLGCASLPTGQPAPAPAAAPTPAAQVQTETPRAFFDRHWAWVEAAYPEWSTYRGNHRFGDRLTDASPQARAARDTEDRRWLAQARALLASPALTARDRVSLRVFVDARERDVALQPFTGFRSMSIRALGGFQTDLAELMLVTPVADDAQIEQLLQRFAAWPRRVDDEIAHMREGAAQGWVPTRDVLDRALRHIDKQLDAPLERSVWFEPFLRLPSTLDPAARSTWRAKGRRAIEAHVVPATQRLRSFVADEYRPKAPRHGAFSGYPDGAKAYAALVAQHTTSELSPEQIHAVGVRELLALRARMEAVMRKAGHRGSFASFVTTLHTDRRYHYPSAQALLTHYRDIGKRVDEKLPQLFAELPRATWGVRAMPAHAGADQADYYESPNEDFSRAGFFYANLAAWPTRRRWEAETLVAHEAVPGHHLQGARALELAGLPAFRRWDGHTAYSEGWALYAETLGYDLGLYQDPPSEFGHLQWQAFRAARLVVDTGIHAMGWTRRRAIDFMVERTGVDREFVTAEIDRYVSDPGQALGYMIGKLKIDELRDRARKTLGKRFDIRRFHNALVDHGSLPLGTLEQVIDEWIADEGRQRAAN